MNGATPAEFMSQALQLAARGRYSSFPNPRVGSVVVRDDRVVGQGFHARAGEPHAEVHALRQAGELARGADLYVTLEPCSHQGRTPPCVDAVIAAGIRRVWAAMRDPNPLVAGRGFERLRAAGIEVHTGLLEGPAHDLNRGFVSRMERGRPHVQLKLAASLDGRTAMASGESQWISSVEARADAHRLRAEAGAVLTSAETVIADDPMLTVRDRSALAADLAEGSLRRPPDRIVLDRRGRVPLNAKVWARDGARRFVVRAASATSGPVAPGVESIALAANPGEAIDLAEALQALGREQVNSVLVECGPRLAGGLLRAGLVDELLLYLAPRLLGDAARGLAQLPGLERLADALHLKFTDLRPIGPDLRVTAIPLT